ncbi:MAG: hypothetical protein OSB63_05180 [Planctomycetota bacterium]|nr:hypothetical protein [Planctomycetota bacterium]
MLLSLCLLLNLAICAQPQNPEQVEEFTRVVFEADEVGDTKAMQEALRKYKEDAILAYIGRIERRLDEELPEIEKWVDVFKSTWKATYNTNFAKNYDRYMQRLSTKQRSIRTMLLQRDYPELLSLHFKIISDKAGDWNRAVERADKLVESFTALSDLYYLSLAHNIVGNLYNPNYYAHKSSDSQKSLEAYQAAIEARDRLGLRQDKFYSDTRITLKALNDVLGNHEEQVAADNVKETAETIPLLEGGITYSANAVASIEKAGSKLVHASDAYDEDHYSWLRAALPAVGESIVIPGVSPPVNLLRIGDIDFQLEAGSNPSEEFKLTTSAQVIHVMRKHENGKEYYYAIEIQGGSEDSTYQGIKINLTPTATTGTYFYRTPSVREFDTDLDLVKIYDTNVDGHFGYTELKESWCEGLLPDEWFWRPDALTIGKQKHSQPFNRFVVDKKGQWYEVILDSPVNPDSLSLVPVQPTLGELSFAYKGVKKIKPLSVLIASESSATKGLVIDLMALPKKKMIPIGRYRFLQARFGGKDGVEALVLPDPNKLMLFDVEPEAEADSVPELFIGGKFNFATKSTLDGTDLNISGRDLHLVGDNGERWFRFAGEPFFDVELQVKGIKSSVLARPSVDEASELWDRFFYPMGASLELRKATTEVDVILSYKKHPWFGNVKTTITVK